MAKKETGEGNKEYLLQIAFINWMRSALPEVMVWSVINENAENAVQGAYFKKRGLLAGVHDCHLVWPGRNFATIELKSPDKRPSESKYSDTQKAFSERLDKCGFPHACCQNGEQIESAIRSFGLEPKYPFPRSLSSSQKQMLMQETAKAMWGKFD